jgi:hypothetical protein
MAMGPIGLPVAVMMLAMFLAIILAIFPMPVIIVMVTSVMTIITGASAYTPCPDKKRWWW